MNAVETLVDCQSKLSDEFPNGHYLSAIVVIAEVIDAEGDVNLVIRRDTANGIWKHIGMVQVADADFGETLWASSGDEDAEEE